MAKKNKEGRDLPRRPKELEQLVRERTRELEQANEALRENERKIAAELGVALRLRDLSARLINGARNAGLYGEMLETAMAIMEADFASVQKLEAPEGADEGFGVLRLLAWKNFDAQSARFWELVKVHSASSCGAVLRSGERFAIADVEQCEFLAGTDDLEAFRQSGIRSVQSMPLISRSRRFLGVISTHWRLPHGPGERKLHVLDVLARQIADLIEREDREEELERLVAERTAKLEESVWELEHFSYTIAHDLKAPLRAMKCFAEMANTLCEQSAGKEAKDILGRISTSADRMARLIADALNYSRALRQELPLSDVDIAALLRGMLDSYPDLHVSKAHIQLEGELPIVRGNEAGLTQCFSNLLGNAVKFVKPGEKPHVRVRAEKRDGWTRIWVEDKGIGISNEMLPSIFQMFSRGSKDYEGTGIGLALVRKVTQRMGGQLGVESEPGEGSRFWIEFKSSDLRPPLSQ